MPPRTCNVCYSDNIRVIERASHEYAYVEEITCIDCGWFDINKIPLDEPDDDAGCP